MGYKKTRLIVTSDLKQLVKLPLTTPVQDLSKRCTHDDGRRGLEKISSELYHEWRSIIPQNNYECFRNEKWHAYRLNPESCCDIQL